MCDDVLKKKKESSLKWSLIMKLRVRLYAVLPYGEFCHQVDQVRGKHLAKLPPLGQTIMLEENYQIRIVGYLAGGIRLIKPVIITSKSGSWASKSRCVCVCVGRRGFRRGREGLGKTNRNKTTFALFYLRPCDQFRLQAHREK